MDDADNPWSPRANAGRENAHGAGDQQRGDPLAAAAIGGDPAALRELWQLHRRWIAAILLAHKPRQADVEDLLQDVAAIVVAKIGEVRDEGALRPWLRTVAITVARAAGRKQTRRAAAADWFRRVLVPRDHAAGLNGDARPEGRDASSPRGAGGVHEEGQRLLRLADELPEGYREPLLLKTVRGLSYRQIGELMGLPETTIETRIARARRMLRELAERDGAGEADQAAATVAAGTR